MGGKRPAPYDTGGDTASDTRAKPDEHVFEEDKAKVSTSKAEAHESKIPKAGKNPALAELQALRERQAAEAAQADANE